MMHGQMKTWMLLAAIVALFGVAGFAMGGASGMMIALLIAGGMNLYAYFNSDTLALKMHGARQVRSGDMPEIEALLENLARRAEIPTPKLYMIDTAQPNAFATGRNPQHGAVALTKGLIARLNADELAGVIAHELAHIKHYDTLIMTVTATIAGALSMLANFAIFFGGNREGSRFGPLGSIMMAILAPLAAMLVQMAISRTREYAADKGGAQICGKPQALASALQKIAGEAVHQANISAENNPASAHMFIINPLHMHRMDGLFSTHPRTENRIRALMQLAPSSASAAQHRRGPWG